MSFTFGMRENISREHALRVETGFAPRHGRTSFKFSSYRMLSLTLFNQIQDEGWRGWRITRAKTCRVSMRPTPRGEWRLHPASHYTETFISAILVAVAFFPPLSKP